MTTRWSRAIPVLAAMVGLLLGITLVISSRSRVDPVRVVPRTNTSDDPSTTLQGLIDPAYPLGPEVAETTLDQATEATPIPVLRPQTSAASDQSISGVWLRMDDPAEVFLRYAGGVEVALRRPDFANGFEAFYKGEIDDGYPGELIQVSDVPVFVVPSDGAYIEADFVVAVVFVQVVAADNPLKSEEMTALVESIIESAAKT